MSELATSEVHKARSKVRGDDCEACIYCGLPMGNFHHEHDHMPRPASAVSYTHLTLPTTPYV